MRLSYLLFEAEVVGTFRQRVDIYRDQDEIKIFKAGLSEEPTGGGWITPEGEVFFVYPYHQEEDHEVIASKTLKMSSPATALKRGYIRFIVSGESISLNAINLDDCKNVVRSWLRYCSYYHLDQEDGRVMTIRNRQECRDFILGQKRFESNVSILQKILREKGAKEAAKKACALALRRCHYYSDKEMDEFKPFILMDPEFTVKFAMEMGRRWAAAEPKIMKSPWWSYRYAMDVLGHRWTKAEPIIKSDPRAWGAYQKAFA